MDIFYIFQHTQDGDREILYSLRSVAENLPWVRKVWILGDRPQFLTADASLAQHVSHQEIAWIGRWRVPVRNNFILTLMASLIPGLDDEFLWFADDYVILQPLDADTLRKRRAIEDLARKNTSASGLFKQAIWRTKDVLTRLNFPAVNFEVHLPQYYRREWVWQAFRTFRDFVSEDRYYGMLANTAIMNYVIKTFGLDYEMLLDDGRFVGIYPKFVVGMTAADFPQWRSHHSSLPKDAKITTKLLTPAVFRDVCRRKSFLNFNDDSFPGIVADYLAEKFAAPCRFEHTP